MKTALRLSAVLLLICNPASNAEEPGLPGILPAKLEDASGKEVDPSSLKGKTVGLYFSAHWCPPCRAFTPSLVKFRDKHAEEDFEIVTVFSASMPPPPDYSKDQLALDMISYRLEHEEVTFM